VREAEAIAKPVKLRGDRKGEGNMGDRKPYEAEGDRTSEGMMNDCQQSEDLWSILFERLRQREVDGSRAIAPSMMEES
jgi:hypothetical protein